MHRWFQKWVKNGALKKAMNKIISYAEQEGLIKLAKSFIDGTFLRSKNGSDNVGKTKVGKGHKLMAIVDENGIPVSVNVTSANPHESQLVEDTLQKISTQQLPEKIIGDRAYDSDHLDDLMNEYNIQMIAPHKSNRVNKTQDGRKLRSYKQRWRVEDFYAKIQRFRKILIRYERHFDNFEGFVHAATMMVIAKMIGLLEG